MLSSTNKSKHFSSKLSEQMRSDKFKASALQ